VVEGNGVGDTDVDSDGVVTAAAAGGDDEW
jgi:hypothetical protein